MYLGAMWPFNGEIAGSDRNLLEEVHSMVIVCQMLFMIMQVKNILLIYFPQSLKNCTMQRV